MRQGEHEPNPNDRELQGDDDAFIVDELGPVADFLLDLFLAQEANAQPVDNSLTNDLTESTICEIAADGSGADSLTSTSQS